MGTMAPLKPAWDRDTTRTGGVCETVKKGLEFGMILKSRVLLKAPALRGVRAADGRALLVGLRSVFSGPWDLVGNSCKSCN